MASALPGKDIPDDSRPVMPPRDLFMLSFLWFPINMFWTAMLQLLLPMRVQDVVPVDEKGTYLGYIGIAGAIATTVVQLLVAPASDASANPQGRRHPFIIWGVAFNVLASVGFALAGNFWMLAVCFFGVQLFLNVANGPYQALLPDNVRPSQHGIASSYMGGMLLIGQLLGALILFLLMVVQGKMGVLVILSVINALLIFGTVLTVRNVPDRPAPPEEQIPLSQAMAQLTDLKVKENPSFFQLLYSRFFINLAYNTAVYLLAYYLQDVFFLPKALAEGKTGQAAIEAAKAGAEGFVPVLLVAVTLAGLVGTLAAARGLKRYTMKQLVYLSCALIAVAAGIFAVAPNLTVVVIVACLFGAAWGTFQAVDWALAVNLLPEGGAAKYMAVWHVCMTVPQILAPAFGIVADYLNKNYADQFGFGVGWRGAFLATVLYIAIGAFLLRWVREKPVARDTTEERPVVLPG
ncbi:MAG: MFS transporter [Armatimonadaceae bacterium]